MFDLSREKKKLVHANGNENLFLWLIVETGYRFWTNIEYLRHVDKWRVEYVVEFLRIEIHAYDFLNRIGNSVIQSPMLGNEVYRPFIERFLVLELRTETRDRAKNARDANGV